MNYFRRTRVILIILFMMQGSSLAQIKDKTCDGSINKPCIVADTDASDVRVKHFRDPAMIAAVYHGNQIGLSELRISGSEVPSEKAWQEIADYLVRYHIAKNKPIVVLDLRQESHGYLNGNSITLVTEHDWINKGKTNVQAERAQQAWLHSLKKQKRVKDVLSKEQYTAKEFTNGKAVTVKSVKSEKNLVTKIGFAYKHLYFTDHIAPNDTEIDEFVRLVRNASKDTWFHVHCRGGKGRTTTAMVMYDMLKNADKVSFEEIIARHAAVPPFYNLLEVDRGDSFLNPYYEQRALLLAQFYKYAQQVLQGYQGPWSEWKQRAA